MLHLHETYSKVSTCKHLSNGFLIHNGLKQGDALSQLLFILEYAIRRRKPGGTGMERDASTSGLCRLC
jgi:hypothetical protein